MKQNVPAALHRHVQHHALFRGEFPSGQHGELFQLGAFQLRHETHGADVHAEKGDTPPGSRLGHVQDGSVAAEADHQLGIGQFSVQPGKTQIFRQLVIAVYLKGQAQFGLNARVFQNLDSASHRLKVPVPVGIGGQNDIFHEFSPLSSV